MELQGFLHVGTTEVFNNYRTWKRLGDCRMGTLSINSLREPCRGLSVDLYGDWTPEPDEQGYAGTPYNAPVNYNALMRYLGGWSQIDWDDDDPWDDGSPASGDFVGFWVESFSLPSPARRTAYPRISGGSRLGPLRQVQIEMPLDVLLISRNERGMWFGYEWLEALLVGGSGCGGWTGLIRKFCTSALYPLEGLWQISNVGLLDPISDEGSPLKTDTSLIRRLSFTLVAGDSSLVASGLGD